jgi:hypothetical protein
MSNARSRLAEATVVVDSRGSILSVAIETPSSRRQAGITDGPLIEGGQRVVKVALPVESARLDPDELLAKVRASLPGPTKKKRARPRR